MYTLTPELLRTFQPAPEKNVTRLALEERFPLDGLEEPLVPDSVKRISAYGVVPISINLATRQFNAPPIPGPEVFGEAINNLVEFARRPENVIHTAGVLGLAAGAWSNFIEPVVGQVAAKVAERVPFLEKILPQGGGQETGLLRDKLLNTLRDAAEPQGLVGLFYWLIQSAGSKTGLVNFQFDALEPGTLLGIWYLVKDNIGRYPWIRPIVHFTADSLKDMVERHESGGGATAEKY